MKREFLELQALGEKLINLSADQLQGISLEEPLRDAVLTAREIKSHGALRRQKQLIGKLMRSADAEQIRRDLNVVGRHDQQAKQLFRSAEQWRDRVVAEGIGVIGEYQAMLGKENKELEALARQLESVANERKRTELRRNLFRAIHRDLVAKMQSVAN